MGRLAIFGVSILMGTFSFKVDRDGTQVLFTPAGMLKYAAICLVCLESPWAKESWWHGVLYGLFSGVLLGGGVRVLNAIASYVSEKQLIIEYSVLATLFALCRSALVGYLVAVYAI